MDAAELVSIRRSAAMLHEVQTYGVPRELLMELCDEILEARQLLERLGTDLRAVAARSRPVRTVT